MSKRTAILMAPTDVGAAGTRVIDISLRGNISRIAVLWRCTVVTVSAMIGNLMNCITRLEVIDGSEVLFSATGSQAQGINFYEEKVLPLHHLSLTVGDEYRAVVHINFGRWLWDNLLALNPAHFDNLQLRISYDEDACNTAVVVNAMSVLAYVDDDPATGGPNGFLLTREVQSYPMAVSGHEYITIPTDYPIRALYLRAWSTDHDPRTLLTNVKLSVENDKSVPFDIPSAELIDLVCSRYGEIGGHMIMDAVVTANVIYLPVSQYPSLAIEYGVTAFVTAQSHFALSVFTGGLDTVAASVDITKITAEWKGYIPHETIPLELGDMDDPATWLPVAGLKDVRLDVQASADADAGDTGTVVVQQARYY